MCVCECVFGLFKMDGEVSVPKHDCACQWFLWSYASFSSIVFVILFLLFYWIIKPVRQIQYEKHCKVEALSISSMCATLIDTLNIRLRSEKIFD